MEGIDLSKPIEYKLSSMRFFKEGDRHITRVCEDDVLLLVFDGVLSFIEDGEDCNICRGEYHIQRHGSFQTAQGPSDKPAYLYVHFLAEWSEEGSVLPKSGKFSCERLLPAAEELDRLSHSGANYIACAGRFYGILSALDRPVPRSGAAAEMAKYVDARLDRPFRLDELCREFHFSKNRVITIFRNEFGLTPVAYVNRSRLRRAEYLIEVTSDSLGSIAEGCGFQNYSHFYRLFYRRHGISPELWRAGRRREMES